MILSLDSPDKKSKAMPSGAVCFRFVSSGFHVFLFFVMIIQEDTCRQDSLSGHGKMEEDHQALFLVLSLYISLIGSNYGSLMS